MRSCVAVTRIAAISRDSESKSRHPDGTESNTRVYAAASPRIDPREIEWVRSDSVDNGGPIATTTRNNPRRCCRTSTSSGYSSHSPPLSAGSYSYYASATSALTSTSVSTKDPYGGLAVIHESETIPRPVWPCLIYHHAEDRNTDYKGIYTCRVCDCTYSYSLPPSPAPPSKPSAREVLFELSRTLNSVIDGDVTKTPEEILRDISRIVSLRIGSKNDGVYECVCPSWTLDDKNLTTSSYVKNVPSKVNPVNSKLYNGPRCLYGHDSMRSVTLLTKDRITRCEKDGEAGNSIRKNSGIALKPCETTGPSVCQYMNGRHIENNTKLSFGLDKDSKRCRNDLASTESKYTMLKCGDVGSSSEGTIASSNANNWNHRLAVKSLIGDFDFTLDVTRAERLGRTIAQAKQKRRWCRILTILFGLIFFILSVMVVSLSVTRGRKVFGSM